MNTDDASAVAIHPVDIIKLRYEVNARRHLDARDGAEYFCTVCCIRFFIKRHTYQPIISMKKLCSLSQLS